MKRSVKVAQAPANEPEEKELPTESVVEELPEATPATTKSYESAQDSAAFFGQEEELLRFPALRFKVGTSTKGHTELVCRKNGRVLTVYEAQEGTAFPDGLVAGSFVTAIVAVRAHDAIETKQASNGVVYQTAYAVEFEEVPSQN